MNVLKAWYCRRPAGFPRVPPSGSPSLGSRLSQRSQPASPASQASKASQESQGSQASQAIQIRQPSQTSKPSRSSVPCQPSKPIQTSKSSWPSHPSQPSKDRRASPGKWRLLVGLALGKFENIVVSAGFYLVLSAPLGHVKPWEQCAPHPANVPLQRTSGHGT